MENMCIIAERIKFFRLCSHLSQKQLAEKADVSQAYISSIESGKQKNITIDILYRIADALNIKINDLFEEYDESRDFDVDEEYLVDEESMEEIRNASIYRCKVMKTFYPPKFFDAKITNLLEFLIYLPLMPSFPLYDALRRISGETINVGYICSNLNAMYKGIKDSPEKKYADMLYQEISRRREEKNPSYELVWYKAFNDKEEYLKCQEAYFNMLQKKEKIVMSVEALIMELRD